MVTGFFVVVGVGLGVVGATFGAAGGKYVGLGFSTTLFFVTAGVGLKNVIAVRNEEKKNIFFFLTLDLEGKSIVLLVVDNRILLF